MTRVYVSATDKDLRAGREMVRQALRRLRIADVALESPDGDAPALERRLADIEDCDLYVGIFAWHYGPVPEGHAQSVTEVEYRHARKTGKDCLIFLLSEQAPWPRAHMDQGPNGDRIEALRAELARDQACRYFSDVEHLAAVASAAVAVWLVDSCAPALGPHTLDARKLQHYYNQLRQQYGGLDLDSLTPPQRDQYLLITLMSVFVEQSVREDPPPVEMPREWLRRLDVQAQPGAAAGFPAGLDPAELAEAREAYLVKPLERLLDAVTAAERSRLVLLGDPGSGKSTAARYLALSLTGAHTDIRLASLAGHLPLLIELRSYAALVAEGTCDGFLNYLDHLAGTEQPGLDEAVLRPYLERGSPTIAIFDGLDEVFDRDRRQRILDQIAEFTAAYPHVRVIVTARTVGYDRHPLSAAGFDHYTVQDLDDRQIDEFLTRWCRSAMYDRRAEAEIRRARLLEALRQSTAMRELAGNPMLLTVLAIVSRNQSLPRDRWKLYDHAATVLVEQWDVNRRLRDDHPGLDFIDVEDKKELLRRLAYRIQWDRSRRAANCIHVDEISQVFVDYLRERRGRDQPDIPAAARHMIDQFRERNFILSRYGSQLYGFVHRTFLEFFCADAIVRRFTHHQWWRLGRVKDLFRTHWPDPSWREVLRLVAGALHERHTAQLISLLTTEAGDRWPARELPRPPWNLALAVQCLADVRNLLSVAQPAEALLRKLVLLLEHSVTVDDRYDPATQLLIEEEILPAARVIGPYWPGREAYLFWYRRRGIRALYGPVMGSAARLAAVLAEPSDEIAELIDEELSDSTDTHTAYAAVAGLAELVHRSTAAYGVAPTPEGRRARALLIERACGDSHTNVRMAAVLALGERFSPQQEICELLVDRARKDSHGGVRLAAIRTLGERYGGDPAVRHALVERCREDRQGAVRRAAVQFLGERYAADDDLYEVLTRRLCEDTDPGVVGAVARILTERYGAEGHTQTHLVKRLREDTDAAVRRAAVDALCERTGVGTDVRRQLIDVLREDADPGVLRAVARVLTRSDAWARGMRDVLVGRVEDGDERIRRAALNLLADAFPGDPEVRAALVWRACHDPDPSVRLAAVQALVPVAAEDAAARAALRRQSRADHDVDVRLTATRALADRPAADPDLIRHLAEIAHHDGDPGVRLAVMRGLPGHASRQSSGDEAVRVAVRVCREDLNRDVRLAALTMLINAIGDSAEAVDAVLDRVRTDTDGDVVFQAATALADVYGPTEHLRRDLAGRVSGSSPGGVRLAAVRLLARWWPESTDVRTVLAQRLRVDSDATVLEAAAAGLARDGVLPDEHLATVTERVTGREHSIRAVAMRILGEHLRSTPAIRETVLRLARDGADAQVRRTAVRALGHHLADHPQARAVLIDLLADPDWSVWESTVRLLAEHHGADEDVRRALVRLAGDAQDPPFRRLAAQVLTSLPGADPDLLPDVRRVSGPGGRRYAGRL